MTPEDGHRIVVFALRLGRGQNAREHHMVRAKRVKAEKEATLWALAAHGSEFGKPPLPINCVLGRHGPSNGLDDDNLAGSLKAVRDAVAQWLGVDDKHRAQVRYLYTQARSREWHVRIRFSAWTPPET